MVTISIYRTDWKSYLSGIVALLCSAVCIFALFHGKTGDLRCWTTLFLFGIGGVFMLEATI